MGAVGEIGAKSLQGLGRAGYFSKPNLCRHRIIFKSAPGAPSWLGWINDYPDADLNLSARLQQLTSLNVTERPERGINRCFCGMKIPTCE